MNPAESIAPLTLAERLAALRALTLTIREHLLAREWAQAAELDLTRRAGIAELFDDRPSAEDLPVLVTGLRELVALNDELLGLMAHQRRALDRHADLLVAGRRMGDAYLGSPARR